MSVDRFAWRTRPPSRSWKLFRKGHGPLKTVYNVKYLRLLSLVLLASSVFADEGKDDAQYAIYMGDAGVIVLKLQIRVGGKSPHEIFQQYVDDLMVSLDTNHDGVVTVEEAQGKYLTPADAIQAQLVTPPGGTLPSYIPDASPKDGKITKQEFSNYFKRIGMQPFSIVYQPRMMPAAGNRRARPTGIVSEIPLFAKLDTNVDGKLSANELRDALKTLRKLDLDDDETISAAELSPIGNSQNVQQPNTQAAPIGPFLGIGFDESLPKQVRRLIDKYSSSKSAGESAKNRNQKLSRMEIGLSEAAFAKLDLDGDGQLDFEELRQFLTAPEPTFSIAVNLDSKEPLKAEASQAEFRERLKTTPDGSANINFDTTMISISRGNTFDFATVESLVKSQFMAADRDANGYLEKPETEQIYLYGATFENLDADKNGKVFIDEFTAYFKLRFDAARSKTVLTICEMGRTLFEVLDKDRDRRLSARELNLAADRLSLWDKDGDGLLSESEVPMQFRLTVARGNLPAFGGNFGGNRYDANATLTESNSGPVWFKKMDKNRDGEVSHREFLGDLSTFDQLDRNHDGFIDLSESVQTVDK